MKRADLERLFAKAMQELDPAARVGQALPAASRVVPARVVAIGKAAPAMAEGAVARWGEAIERCLVVAPDATDTRALRRAAERAGIAQRLVVMHAAHPLPDARSVRAGEACLDAVSTDDARRIVVLLSGGASALACAPIAGVSLRTKRAITRAMLESGALIQDVNTVRKHLSRLKGGGLARAASPNPVLTVVASDVIGGTASDVGSGPSVADLTSVSDARRLLRRFAASFADVPLARTFAPTGADAKRLRSTIVISPEDLARAFAKLLRESAGLDVRVLPPSQASADELAIEYAVLASRAARRLARGGAARAFVRVAEPSVLVPARAGRGGRSSHVAALVGQAMGASAPAMFDSHRVHELRRDARNVLFAALASDGVDGASGTAGAVVDDRFAKRVAVRLGPDALGRSVARFDTGTLHRMMKTAVTSAPTGHNLADLHVLVVA
jgi:hydroxypyruvate reductase